MGTCTARTAAMALRTYIWTSSLFRSERLSININLISYNALIRSVIAYTCPTWGYAPDAHLLTLQRLQDGYLRATGNLT